MVYLKKMPPLTPSHVFFIEIFGAKTCFPRRLPMNNIPLSVYHADIIQRMLIAGPYLYLNAKMGKVNGKTKRMNSK
jgi:hypothetical protein